MPALFSSVARRLSSVHLELPPSTIMSPRSSSLASLSTVSWGGAPAGTMIQTIRGAFSCLTRSFSVLAPEAPFLTACLTVFSSKSNATTSCSESRRMRCTMLPPIFPSPTKPICVMSWSPRPGIWPALCLKFCLRLRASTWSVLLERARQRTDRARQILSLQPHALRRQPQLSQRVEVADRLGVLERRERERLARDCHILGAVVQELQETPLARAALVELALIV